MRNTERLERGKPSHRQAAGSVCETGALTSWHEDESQPRGVESTSARVCRLGDQLSRLPEHVSVQTTDPLGGTL
jgi:hypothetical protein